MGVNGTSTGAKKGINALVGKLQNEFEVYDIKPAVEFAADL